MAYLVSVSFPVHVLPPLAGTGLEQVRVLEDTPLSHVVLHLLQADQLDHCPSTGIFKVYIYILYLCI